MKAHQAEYSISMMARVLKLSRSGYYAWHDRPESKRAHENRVLTQRIREIHIKTRGIYGAPRIHAKLKAEGSKVSKKRVARLMRAAKMIGITRRKKWKTTKRDEDQRPAPDLVDRQFKASGPNQLWVADITHIPTRTQPIYLATILDVWSRKVVGWSMSTTMPATLVVKALDMAMERRGSPRGVIHHSDQGSQYTSEMFKTRCEKLGVRISMGSVGDCYDNAMAESFFATLESELLNIGPLFDNPKHAEIEIFKYIEGFYNVTRLHSKLQQMSPVAFEEANERDLVA